MDAAQRSVVITDYTFPSLDIEHGILSSLGAVVEAHQCRDENEVIAAVRGAKVVLTQFAPVGRRAIEALHPNATIVRYGVGVDNIDVRAARELGVAVAYVPDYCVEEVAETRSPCSWPSCGRSSFSTRGFVPGVGMSSAWPNLSRR